MEHKGKTAIVTGGARGIGEAICRALAADGASIVIGDLREEEGNATAKSIRDGGGKAVFVKADITTTAGFDALFNAATDPVYMMVNNAGAIGRALLIDTEDALWDGMMAVNLKSVFYGARAAARHMVREGIEGRIVNLASQNGLVCYEAEGAYGVAKAGVIHLTKSFAIELAKKHINVNCVAPGVVKTDISKGLFPPEIAAQRREKITAAQP